MLRHIHFEGATERERKRLEMGGRERDREKGKQAARNGQKRQEIQYKNARENYYD